VAQKHLIQSKGKWKIAGKGIYVVNIICTAGEKGHDLA